MNAKKTDILSAIIFFIVFYIVTYLIQHFFFQKEGINHNQLVFSSALATLFYIILTNILKKRRKDKKVT